MAILKSRKPDLKLIHAFAMVCASVLLTGIMLHSRIIKKMA